jgi:DNA-binding transcriptional LysR family regulator
MDKLRAMEAFVRIVDGGSLTAAAEALGTSLPSMVRTLAALEAELDVRLINRTTRRLALTDEGREYFERCRRVLAEVEDAEAALSARRRTPRGRLRLTAPVMFGRMHVAPLVTEFIAQHQHLQLDLTLLDRVVDLVEEGIDAAVRIGRLPDSSMVAIAVGQTKRVACASADYLKRAGTPKATEDLARHRCISFAGLAPDHQWTFAVGKREVRIPVPVVLSSNQVDAALEACLHGIGIGQFLCYQVQALIDRRRLVRLLPDAEPAPMPIHVLYPHARLLSSNVRAFIDFAVPRLRALRLGGAP